MTVDQNKEKVRHYFEEMIGKTDTPTLLRAIDEMMAPDFVDHDGPDPNNGRKSLREVVPTLMKALPDFRIKVELLVGEGDYVVARWRGTATHTGEIVGIHTTGKRISWTENEIYRFNEGRIAESWGEGTFVAALAEIGLNFGNKVSFFHDSFKKEAKLSTTLGMEQS